ncbi:MAG TPA: VRR-NUC domain-containing protein [Blastocatellia bacterium]|jgi:hypothetical protein
MRAQGKLFKSAPRRSAPLEAVVLRSIKAYLRARNIYHIRINSGAIQTKQDHRVQLAPEGTPDLFVLYKGVSLFVEAKREGEKPTPQQLAQHEFIRESGGRVVVATSIDEVRVALNQIDLQIHLERKENSKQ